MFFPASENTKQPDSGITSCTSQPQEQYDLGNEERGGNNDVGPISGIISR